MFSHNVHNVKESLIYETRISFQTPLLPSFCFPFTNLSSTEWKRRMNHKHKGGTCWNQYPMSALIISFFANVYRAGREWAREPGVMG